MLPGSREERDLGNVSPLMVLRCKVSQHLSVSPLMVLRCKVSQYLSVSPLMVLRCEVSQYLSVSPHSPVAGRVSAGPPGTSNSQSVDI